MSDSNTTGKALVTKAASAKQAGHAVWLQVAGNANSLSVDRITLDEAAGTATIALDGPASGTEWCVPLSTILAVIVR